MALHLSDALYETISELCLSAYPEEACGLLIGTQQGEARFVTRVVPVPNAWDDSATETRGNRFRIPPERFYQEEIKARDRNEGVIGFYHSHPDGPARPSDYDLQQARETFPGYSCIIVSTTRLSVGDIACWVLRDDCSQFDRELLIH